MTEEKNSPTEQKIVEVNKPKIIKPKLTPVYDLLETAVKTWWKNLTKFIKIYLWGILFALIPGAVMVILVVLLHSMSKPELIEARLTIFPGINDGVLLLFFLLVVVCVLFALYLAIRAYIGIFLLVKNNYQGHELEIFKDTKKYFWSYLWLGVLTIIFILLWSLLLIIPGIIFSIFYSFAVYAFFFEDLKGMKAIKRSVNLVKNYWWAVTGRFIVIGIVLYIFAMIISIPLHFTSDKSVFFYIWTSIVQVITFLIGPISLLYFYQIYQDLVKIKK